MQSPEGVPHRLHRTLVVAFATVATRRRSSQATGALVVVIDDSRTGGKYQTEEKASNNERCHGEKGAIGADINPLR